MKHDMSVFSVHTRACILKPIFIVAPVYWLCHAVTGPAGSSTAAVDGPPINITGNVLS